MQHGEAGDQTAGGALLSALDAAVAENLSALIAIGEMHYGRSSDDTYVDRRSLLVRTAESVDFEILMWSTGDVELGYGVFGDSHHEHIDVESAEDVRVLIDRFIEIGRSWRPIAAAALTREDLLSILRNATNRFPTARAAARLLIRSTEVPRTARFLPTGHYLGIYRQRLRRAPQRVRGLKELVSGLEETTSPTVGFCDYRVGQRWATLFLTPEGDLLGCVVGVARKPWPPDA
ncbi:hypothetical protein [Schumannella luteola]